MAPQETKIGSFRIPSDVYAAMRRKAREERISLNTLANQVLADYVVGTPPTMSSRFVVISKLALNELLSGASEDELKQIGRLDAERVDKPIILARHGEITIDGLANVLSVYAQRTGYGEYTDVRTENSRILTIMHQFGSKGSVMIAAKVDALFQMAGIRMQITATEDAVVVKIPNSE